MPQLYGMSWNRRDLEAHAAVEQIAGIKRYFLADGFEKDTEIIEVETGAGLRFGVCPSRALDIVWAKHGAMNLCWRGDNGIVHPAFYNEDNFGWIRGFPGGLVTTCGLGSFGPPCEDEGEYFGIHDRISYTPAREVSARTVWTADGECEFRVGGHLRQTRLFGANLRLDREIVARLGSNEIVLRDTVTNEGFVSTPMVVLYHCNFGFPLLAPGAEVFVTTDEAEWRDLAAQAGADRWHIVDPPEPGFAEQVFFHKLVPDAEGRCRAGIKNPVLNLQIELEFSAGKLPFLTQWRALASGNYALGLEPSNAPLASRATLRRDGTLPILEPGESREFEVTFRSGSILE